MRIDARDRELLVELLERASEPLKRHVSGLLQQDELRPPSPLERVTGEVDSIDQGDGTGYADSLEEALGRGLQTYNDEAISNKTDTVGSGLRELRRQNRLLEQENRTLREKNRSLEDRLASVGQLTRASIAEATRGSEAETPEPPSEAAALFPGARSCDPMEWLERYYGRYLAYFGAHEDTLFLPDLRRLDHRLVESLHQRQSRLRRAERMAGEPSTPTLGQIVPTKKDKGDRELRGSSLEEILQDRRLATLLYQRLHRLLWKSESP